MEIVLEGNLLFWGPIEWKLTYVILYNYFMYLYSSKSDIIPRGVIFLEGSSVASVSSKGNRKDCFQLSTSEKNYYFAVANTEEISKWVTTINKTIQKMRSSPKKQQQQ